MENQLDSKILESGALDNKMFVFRDVLTPASSLPFSTGCGIMRPSPWIIQLTTLHNKYMWCQDMPIMRAKLCAQIGALLHAHKSW